MQTKLQNIFSYLESNLIERTVPIRLSLLAALSGEHLLLFGPPGTAKSEMARKLCNVFSNINYFERMLTRFSVPEELFGPLSIKALEDDRYHRLTENYLPDASVAFIDEIFKANSAILNSLLTLLNEREFDNGSVREQTPLISVIAASNELPEDEGLDALFDRFLLRYQVAPVSDNGFDELLYLSPNNYKLELSETLSVVDIENIQIKSATVVLSEAAHKLIHNLRAYLSEKSIYISDRRWRKALKFLQVCAYTNGKDSVVIWDCVLLAHLMWQKPEQLDELNDWFIEELNLDIAAVAKRIEKLVITWEAQLDTDAKKRTHKTNSHGEYLYKTPEGKITTQHERVKLAERNDAVLFMAPPDQIDRTNDGKGYTLDELQQKFFDESYKQTHIDGRWVDIQNYINNTQNRLVNRVEYDALDQPFLYSVDYLKNQQSELHEVIQEVNDLSENYLQVQADLSEIKNSHLWLAGSLVDTAYSHILAITPKLIDYNQRLLALIVVSESLNVSR